MVVLKKETHLSKRESTGTTTVPCKRHLSVSESATNKNNHTNAQTTEANAVAQVIFTSVTNSDKIMVMKSLPCQFSLTSTRRLNSKKDTSCT